MEITPGSLTIIGLVATLLALVFGLASYVKARQRASSPRRWERGMAGGMATVPVVAVGSADARAAAGAQGVAREVTLLAPPSSGAILDEAVSYRLPGAATRARDDGATRLVYFREYIPESGRISRPASAQPRGGRGFQWA